MAPEDIMDSIRIQKWFSQLGVASRREAESWISSGRVSVNGKVVTTLGQKILPGVDELTIDGQNLSTRTPPKVYWLLHKPDQVMTTRHDGFGRQTIYTLPRLRNLKFLVNPVGRLDYRTEGLLILTNDGELTHRLTHPRYKVPRHYHVLITGRLNEREERDIQAGIQLEDGKTLPCELRYAHGKNLGASRGSWYMITVYEGRNRLIRRLFEHFNHRVVRLLRVGFGDLRLPEDLRPGEYLQLTPGQIASLKRSADLH